MSSEAPRPNGSSVATGLRPSVRVLVLDGAPLIRQLLRVHLADLDIELHSVSTIGEVKRAAAMLVPDVVVVALPPDPHAAIRTVEELLGGLATGLDAVGIAGSGAIEVPVLVLAPVEASEVLVRSLQLGAFDALRVPFDPDELRARVRGAARVRRRLDALRRQAQRDALSGLWNRAFFDARLDEEIGEALRHEREVAVIMCDIDGFKRLNDLHGHPFGDEVIAGVGELLLAGRAEDVPCRYGGEEFAIILPSTDIVGATDAAERLRLGISSLRWELRPQVAVTASLGVADLASIGRRGRADALVAAADAALYRAKRSGRDRIEVAATAAD
ncbi:MAG: diguanylate cyclase [Phycisphaerales bacterium]|nr:diguanylate cyclase [Phycisphaerales bacterium]